MTGSERVTIITEISMIYLNTKITYKCSKCPSLSIYLSIILQKKLFGNFWGSYWSIWYSIILRSESINQSVFRIQCPILFTNPCISVNWLINYFEDGRSSLRITFSNFLWERTSTELLEPFRSFFLKEIFKYFIGGLFVKLLIYQTFIKMELLQRLSFPNNITIDLLL